MAQNIVLLTRKQDEILKDHHLDKEKYRGDAKGRQRCSELSIWSRLNLNKALSETGTGGKNTLRSAGD